MINFFATIKTATVISSIVMGSMLLGDASAAITQDTHITIGTAVAVSSVVGAGALYIGRWMQKVNDSIKQLRDAFNSLPCQPKHDECPKKK